MSGIVVLISGRGSNLAAMCNAGLAKNIKCVISNRTDAPGLNIAKKFGITSHVIDHRQFATREEFDKQMAIIIDQYEPQYVILAGFMRILTPWFVSHYAMRLVNIHPSILPAFIGVNAISQAFHAQVKITGVTIHFVTDKLDHGPIIAQGMVSTVGCNNAEELASRIHELEHVIYPFIIQKLIANKITLTGFETIITEKEARDTEFLNEFSHNIVY